MENEKIMTVDEVASYLVVTPPTVYALAQSGKMPGRKIGRLWRFSKPAIVAWSGGGELLSNPNSELKGKVVGTHGLAAFLRVADSTIYEAMQKQFVPGRKVGRQWRFSLLVITEWLKNCQFSIEADDVFNIQQVAALLQLAPNTVYKVAQCGEIPCRKVGRQWRFVESNLYEWLGGTSL